MIQTQFIFIGAVMISFLTTFLVTPFFNRFMHNVGVVGRDVMKKNKTIVADMGGPGVMVGFLSGIFFYIALETLIQRELVGLIYILASLNTILIITLIGIFDTLTALMKEREGKGIFEKLKKRGIPRWLYFFIPLPAAVPLVAVNAGVSKVTLPFIGRIDLGLYYPLICIPLAILCCTNATNFLAGFNGLETGMGSVLLVFLGYYAYIHQEINASIIALTFAFALLAFLRYNWYPAKVFPGDLNYTIGAVCVCVAVIGNMEKYTILCFTPWIIEAILKASSRFEAESYGILQENGVVKPRTKKIQGLTHLVMSIGEFSEKQVSIILIFLEFCVCFLSLFLVSKI